MLFDYGSPLTMVQPYLTPLYASIEYQHFEITSFLLSKGADPNSIILLKDSDNFTTQTILDVALGKKDGRTVSLLITCGADTSKVDKSKLSPSILAEIQKYDPENVEINQSDNDIVNKIDKLISIIDDFKQHLNSSIDFIHSIVDIKKVNVPSLIAQISQQYDYINTVIELLPETIDEKRKTLLDYQFQQLTKDDNDIFLAAFNEDFNEWIAFCDNSLLRIQKRFENEQNPIMRESLISIIKYVNKFKKSMDDDKKEILSPFSNSIQNIEYDENKRIELLQINRMYSKVKPTIETISLLHKTFYQESLKIINMTIEFFSKNIELINNITQSHELLEKAGFSDLNIAQIESNNQQRLEFLKTNINQLEEQKEKINNLSITHFKKISKILHN